MAWKDLSIAQRSQLMNIMRHNGISSLSEMRRLYDLSTPPSSSLVEDAFNMQPQAPVYASGGPKKELINRINSTSAANFVQRLKDPNRKFISNPDGTISTHSMAYATDEDRAIVYPEVQEIDGVLQRVPPENALDSAISRRDTLMMSIPEAEWFTRNYKDYYPRFQSYAGGGPKKKETAYARKYREEQEAKARRALEHPTLNNVFRNDTTDNNEKYYDIVKSRYDSAMRAMQRKGFSYEDALRLAPMMVTQNVLEGGWRLSRPDNNFGGMQVNGRFLTFNTPDEFYDAYIDMLDQKWGQSKVKSKNWRYAENLNDWARILNHEDLNLWSEERYNAYMKEHPNKSIYLYAPEWQNNYKPYRQHLAGVEPRVNTYLDMVLEENPYTKEMYSAPIEPVAQSNDGFNLSMDQFQKLLESNREDFASGGHKIHIKKENRGKFTALKKRTGHSASWFKAHGTPAQKKMAVFALNAKKWKHAHGGIKF